MNIRNILSIFAATVAASSTAFGISVPLNTGYDHANGIMYSTGTFAGDVGDAYWQTIAKFPNSAYPSTTSPWPFNPTYPGYSSWNVNPFWTPPVAGSTWISSVANGTSPNTGGLPGYAIFRKCFCLEPGFQGAHAWFRLLADDKVQVWFNTLSQVLVPPSNGLPNQIAREFTQGFKAGKNCIYVLVEDTYNGKIGLSLTGAVTATSGLWSQVGTGETANFGTKYRLCDCEFTQPHIGATAAHAREAQIDEKAVIQEIVKYAEERRVVRASAPRGTSAVPPVRQ